MKLTVYENTAALQKAFAALDFLRRHEVRVGLPSSTGMRNRMILAIQEHGSPIHRIPARPVIRPALQAEETRAAMAKAMKAGTEAALRGDLPAARASLEAAGRAGADGIRAYIDSHIPPPNSPATVRGGWIWNRAANKPVLVPGKGFDKPLYDTGELYRAFSYEIRERE